MNTAIVGAAIAATLLLAGCTPTTSATQPTNSPAPSESSTAVPTPTASAEGRGIPALDELVLTPEGLGANLRVGEPVVGHPIATSSVKWEPKKCASLAYAGGAWVPQYPETSSNPGEEGYPFVFTAAKKTSPVDLVTIWSDEIRTDRGVGVGSTLDELKAAYPTLKLVKHAGFTDLYLISGSTGQLVFDVATKTGPEVSWAQSRIGTVIWVYLEDKGHLLFSIANTAFGKLCPTE